MNFLKITYVVETHPCSHIQEWESSLYIALWKINRQIQFKNISFSFTCILMQCFAGLLFTLYYNYYIDLMSQYFTSPKYFFFLFFKNMLQFLLQLTEKKYQIVKGETRTDSDARWFLRCRRDIVRLETLHRHKNK